MRALDVFFHWPEGGVWSNLLASLLWALPAIFLGHRKLHRMHSEQKTHQRKIEKHLGVSDD